MGCWKHQHGARQRISFLGQAVWRYHPEADRFELFAEGGGEPWTLSFDSKGRAFSGDNGGNSRGFHWVEGGRYEKNWPKHGPFTRPFSFGFIPHMDHEGVLRAVRDDRRDLRGRKAAWVRKGQLISGMALTSRMQATRLVADEVDFQNRRHRCTRDDGRPELPSGRYGVGPTARCTSPTGATSGWITPIRATPGTSRAAGSGGCVPGTPGRRLVDLAGRSSQELVQLLGDEESGTREHARRLLGERQDVPLVPQLRQLVRERRGAAALEALWTANLIVPIDPGWASELLVHPDAAVRAWALRLFRPAASIAPSMRDTLVRLARTEPDAGSERAREHDSASRASRCACGARGTGQPGRRRVRRAHPAPHLVGARTAPGQ